MRRLWLLGIMVFLAVLFGQLYRRDPYFYLSAHDLFVRAQAAQQAHHQAQALAYARLAWERQPDNWHYAEFLAFRYLEAGQSQAALDLFQQVWQAQPSPTVLGGLVSALQQQKRSREALELVAAFLERQPQEATALRLAAELASQERGGRERALVYYQRLFALNPQDGEIRQRLIDLLTAAGRFAEAIPLQEQVVAETPDQMEALHQLALLYHWQRDYQAAAATYQRLLELAVEDQALRLEAARNAEAAGNREEALEHYLELYSRSGGRQEYALVLARLWSQSGRHAEAAAVLAPLMSGQPSLAERRFYALELLLAGRPQPALQQYLLAWEAGDTHRETILNLARLSAQQRQFGRAAGFWDEAARRQLLDQDLRREAALTYAYARRYEDAVAVLQPVTPREPKLLLFLAQMHLYQKHWRQAVHYYQEYLRQVPAQPAVQRQLAQTLSLFPEGLAQAAEVYEAAVRAGGDPALLLQRAAVLLQLAQNATDEPRSGAPAADLWAAAAAALAQVPAAGLSPALRRQQAQLYLWLGDHEQALACLEAYLREQPLDRAAFLDKARVLIYLQRGAEAATLLRRLADWSPPPASRHQGGAAAGVGEGADEAGEEQVPGDLTAARGGDRIELLTLFLEAALAERHWPEAQRRTWQLYLLQLPPAGSPPPSWTAARQRLQAGERGVPLPPGTRVAMVRALCHHPDLDKDPDLVRIGVDLCLANLQSRRRLGPEERRFYQASLQLLSHLLPRLSSYEDLGGVARRLPGLRLKSPEYLAAISHFTAELGRQGGKLQYLAAALDDLGDRQPARRPGDLLYLASLASELGDYRTARMYFDRLCRLRPHDHRLAALRLQVLAAAKDTGRLLKALEGQPQTPETTLEMARVYLSRHQYDGALAVLAAVPRGHPTWPEAQMLTIQAYRGLQQYPAALAAIRELRQEAGDTAALLMAEAQVLEAMDDRAATQAAYTAAIRQAPDTFTAEVARARLARFRHDWAGAYRHFAAALQERPQEIEILNELEQIREQLRPTLAARNLPAFWRGVRRPAEALRPWQFGREDRDPGMGGRSQASFRSLLPVSLPSALIPETSILRDRSRVEALQTRWAGCFWLSRVLPVHLALSYQVYQQHTQGPGPAGLNLGLQPVFSQTSHNRTTWERGEVALTLGPLVLGEKLTVTGELSGRRYWRQLKQQVTQFGQKGTPPIIINTLAAANLTDRQVRNRLLGSAAVALTAGGATDITLRYARRDIFEPDPAAYPRLFQQVIRLDTLPLLTLHQTELAVDHQFFPGLSYQANLAQAFFSDLNRRFSLYQGLRWQAVKQPDMHLDLTPSYYLALYRFQRQSYFSPHAYHALGLTMDFDRQLFPLPLLSRFLFLVPTLVVQVTAQVVDNDGRWGPALATLAGLEAEPLQNLYVGLHYFFFKEWASNYWFNSLMFGLKWRF